MNILITGSRAPASMDIMRSFIRQGYQVYSVDSMNFPLGRFVKGLKKHFTIPKPNRNLPQFLDAIKTIVIDYKIDLLIPTCEEVFFISKGYKELSQYTRVFCEPFERLNPLHNKYSFNQLAIEYGLDAPESWLIVSQQDKKQIPQNMPIVLKPIYSRFGSHVIIKPTQKEIEALPLTVPYIAQRFIKGKEYCAYAIAHQGEVLIHSCYHPKYTAGGPAAGIYFEPADIQPITDFIKQFCQQYQFSGQIAFDFILEADKAYVLECNPRITSGFHFISDAIQWSTLLNGQPQTQAFSHKPFMIGMGMIVHGFKHLCATPKQFMRDYRRARDVLKHKAYPGLGIKSLLTIANILARMIKEKKNFHRASTDDIEFNGDYN